MSEISIPYLAEHASSENSGEGTNPGYHPSEEDKKKLQLIDALYSKAKKYRKRYDSRWIDWYKMFRGRQWKEVRPSYRSSEVLNLVFQTIQGQVPILTDARPKLEFLPTIPTETELADILTKVAENDWTHNNWMSTLTEIIYDAHFYGDGFAYVGFNPKAEMGLGCIEFESEDAFFIFPDPQARDVNGKRTKHFITAIPTDIAELKKEYPDKAKDISADVIDFAQGDKADIYQVMFKSPTDSKLIVEGPSGYDSIAKNQALKITLYSKDDDFEEEEQIELKDDGTPMLTDEGNPSKKFVQKLKYPNGRKMVSAGGVLCEDGDFDFDDGQFPFVKLTNYTLPREFWGMGEVEQLDAPQKTINKIISNVLDTMTLMSNPIYIVDDTAGIDTDNLFNKPGLVIEKTAGSEVRRESGVELPSYILPFLNMYKEWFQGISGQTDVSEGIEPSDVTAASAIKELKESQQTRLRLKSRHIDAFLQDFGKLYLSRVFQFYSLPRIVRVTGNDHAKDFFYFHIEKLDKDKDGNPLKDKEGNAVTKRIAHITSHEGQTKQIEIHGDFDVKVATGSSLPFAKDAKGGMAMKLFQLQVIDDEELLKSLDYPNYEKVLHRVHEKQAQAAEAARKEEGEMIQMDALAKAAVKATPTQPSGLPAQGVA